MVVAYLCGNPSTVFSSSQGLRSLSFKARIFVNSVEIQDLNGNSENRL